MSNTDEIIGIVIGLFVLMLLGYVFFTVLWALSPVLSFLFAIALVIVALGILSGRR